MRRALVSGLLVALILGAVLFLGRSRDPGPASDRMPVVEVRADLPWQDTGLDVAEGEPVTLTPEGVWRKPQDAGRKGKHRREQLAAHLSTIH